MADMMGLVELRRVSMERGAQSVMTTGIIVMLVLFVDNWDTLLMVCCNWCYKLMLMRFQNSVDICSIIVSPYGQYNINMCSKEHVTEWAKSPGKNYQESYK